MGLEDLVLEVTDFNVAYVQRNCVVYQIHWTAESSLGTFFSRLQETTNDNPSNAQSSLCDKLPHP